MTPEQAEVWNLKEQGYSLRQIAEKLGTSEGAVKKRYSRARRWANLPGGVQEALRVTGIDAAHARFGYRRIEAEDGSFNTVFWRLPEPEAEDAAIRVRELLGDIPRVKPITPPAETLSDLLTLYVVSDLHSGMLAWRRETGEDYDTGRAMARLRDWIGACVAGSPRSETAVILFNGDTMHADDQTNATPKSKHALDVDSRFFRTAERTILGISAAVDLALHHHQTVHVQIKPGNHDPTSYLILLFSVAERYRDDPRVIVGKEPSEFWAHQFGRVLLASHHGDKAKAQSLVLYLADTYPEMWGQTRWRYLWTGHMHHHKSQDIGGVHWEQARAVAPKDAYAAAHAYSSRSEIQAVTYHRDRGEVSRVKVAA